MKNILEALGIGVVGVVGCIVYVVFYAVCFAGLLWLGFKILSWIF